MQGFMGRGSTRLSLVFASAMLVLIHLAPVSAAAADVAANTPEQLIGNRLAAAHAGDTEAFL
jgi:hypothetical protein